MTYPACVRISVRTIELHNFMSHTETILSLPERGIVSVSGGNGAGKSTFIEAISVCLWGKTLRDANPWTEGVAGSVLVRLDGLVVERSISKSGVKKLTWRLDHEAQPQNFGTVTKSQEALDRVIGTWEMWRRTHVLSSQDVASFSGATNGEKCRLLETMLGLGRFDKARELAAAELTREVRAGQVDGANVSRLEAKVHELQALIESNKRSLSEVQEQELEEPSPSVIASAEQELAELSATESERNTRISEASFKLSVANAELIRASAGKCSQCSTPFNHSEDDLLRMGDAVREAKEAKTQAEYDYRMSVSARTDARRLLDQLYRLRSDAQAAMGTVHLRRRLQKVIAEDSDFLLDTQDELAVCKASFHKSLEAQEAGKLAVKSLSVGGARSHILKQAIDHVEVSANAWMSRLTPSLSIRVSPYTEGASGALRNEISIEVIGAGGEDGYKGCSGGERRMIDVVLMLALGEAAAAAHGSSVGTYLLDEVFDSLDAKHAANFETLLRELCEDRACMFISHAHQITGNQNLYARKLSTGTVMETL